MELTREQEIRILVVDDEPSSCIRVKQILENDGYSVRGVGDIQSALEELERWSPDVVITDLGLPNRLGEEIKQEGGMTIVERIKNGALRINVLVVSAGGMPQVRARLAKMGVEFLGKPYQEIELLQCLELTFDFI